MALSTKYTLDNLEKSAIRKFAVMGAETPGCIGLTLGEPDLNTAEEIKALAVSQLAANDTHYPPNNGKPFLRQAIAEHEKTRGLNYSPEEIIVTVGATQALFVSLSTVINPGDEVIILAPAYTLYASVTSLNGGTPVILDTSANSFQVTSEMLSSVISERTKAIVLNTPNNPTGCILNAASLKAIADAAREHDFYVICDDVYGRLVYVDGYKSFGESFGELRDRTIICDSFSKPYAMTGWRLGWIAADEKFIAAAGKIQQFNISSVPSFVQHAAAHALETDVAPALEIYRQRRELVLDRLKGMGLDVVTPEGAFYALPSIAKYGLSSDEMCERLIKEAGVAFIPGSCFGAEGHIRLSYCCSIENINEGLNRLESFLAKL